jgi:hypothetical protein
MYTVDDMDIVIEIEEVPLPSIGAPCPMILSAESFLHLAYFVQRDLEGWDGIARIVGEESEGEECALVKFRQMRAHMFGPPNDEAFHGHPLADRGLKPYAIFEVKNSSWIRVLERMNRVHPCHKPEHFLRFRHFIFAFHDTTLECVAHGFDWTTHAGSVSRILRDSWPEGKRPTI